MMQVLGDRLADTAGELRMRVEARADGGAADGELVQAGARHEERVLRGFELRYIARELLSESQGRGVLQVRAADLDDAVEGRGLRGERFLQRLDRGGHVADGERRGDVHRGGKDVVRRLAEV